jgi:hypothetical protein
VKEIECPRADQMSVGGWATGVGYLRSLIYFSVLNSSASNCEADDECEGCEGCESRSREISTEAESIVDSVSERFYRLLTWLIENPSETDWRRTHFYDQNIRMEVWNMLCDELPHRFPYRR